MSRRSVFVAVRVVGGLVPSGLLERVGSQDSSLEGVQPSDYYLAAGERLGEAITRSWNRLRTLWERFSERFEEEGALTGPTRQEWLLPLFQELGFGQLDVSSGLELEGKPYPISHLWQSIPIHLVGVGVDLERRSPGVVGAASASPHGLVQEFLNRSEDHLWGVVSNGRQLRLLRDNASLTRTAYVEFDLREMFEGEVYSDFALLWLICHASRLEGPAGKQVLEQWREESARQGVRALNDLQAGVETAIETVGSAAIAHPDNIQLRRRLEEGTLDAQELYRQLLRVVYRFLFLLVSESRGLLLDPTAEHEALAHYRLHYSITRIRELSESTRGGPHGDLWQQHRLIARILEARGEPSLGLPALGGFLWSQEATAELDDLTIPNKALLDAIRALTTVRPPGGVIQRVDYANLGAEELGSIYEALLEYLPQINLVAGTFQLETAAGNERKTTGSYYTPTSLINELLNSALDPVLEEAATADDPETAILNLKVVDPAAGSGHFLIAAANRIADRLARIRTSDNEPSPEQLRTALRDVIGHCIHAVDVNPMAVELAKVALWIEAMEPGKPLTFLDHHIVCGNSLLGATPRLLEEGIPDGAYVALTGDDKELVKTLRARNRQERKKGLVALPFGDTLEDTLQHAAEELEAIDALDDNSITSIQKKQERLQQLVAATDQRRLRLAADAWTAAFMNPKTKDTPQITTATVNAVLHDPDTLPKELTNTINQLAQQHRFHHWHLSFPHIFTPTRGTTNPQAGWPGGFDIVLGNPPWEQEEVREAEFFAEAAPGIARMDSGRDRDEAIEALEKENPVVFRWYVEEKRVGAALTEYFRSSGRFPTTGIGRMNTAALFTESFAQVRSSEGAVGLIVPTAIFTDRRTNSSQLVKSLLENRVLTRIVDIENRGRFAAVHNQQRFSCVTITSPETWELAMRSETTADLGEEYQLSAEEVAQWNPELTSVPLFGSLLEKDLAIGIYERFETLGSEAGWGAKASAVYHMTNDRQRGSFYNSQGPGRRPLFESKMVGMFNHRAADVYISSSARSRKAQSAELTNAELAKADREVRPRYWVDADECRDRLGESGHHLDWSLVWKDVSSATNTRTLIPCILPGGASGHTLWTLFLPERSTPEHLALAGLLGSTTADFLARKQVAGNHVTDSLVLNLPVPSPMSLQAPAPWDVGRTILDWLAERVLELSATSSSLAMLTGWVLGEPRVFRWDRERRLVLEAELSAGATLVYGLSKDESNLIHDNFATTASVYLQDLLNLSTHVGERLRQSVETGKPYQTVLDPPPSDLSLCHPR